MCKIFYCYNTTLSILNFNNVTQDVKFVLILLGAVSRKPLLRQCTAHGTRASLSKRDEGGSEVK